MRWRWPRIVVAALFSEIVPITLLVAAVFLFGPGTLAADRAFAERTGRWLGPLAGAIMTFFASWWAARTEPAAARRTGVFVGVLAAGTDVSILVAAATPFEWLFVMSNVLRVLAGMAGGVMASHSSPRHQENP
jgi:hypothetical protein